MGNRCLYGTQTDSAEPAHYFKDSEFLDALDVQTDKNIQDGLKKFLNTDGSLKAPFDKFLNTPTQRCSLESDCADEKCKGCMGKKCGGMAEPYAEDICSLGQLFLNERSIGVPAHYAYYAQIIPDCADQSEKSCMVINSEKCKRCDAAILQMQDLCWPRNAKAHMLAHMDQVGHPSMALILGALATRGGFEGLDATYVAMRQAAGEGFEKFGKLGGPMLADEKKTYLLMSSHDLTTNLLRYIMQEAALPGGTTAVSTYSNKAHTNVSFSDVVLSYDVMFIFELEGKKLTVKNFLLTLEDSRQACGFANRSNGDLLNYADIPTFWEGDLTVFLTKVGATLAKGVGAPGSNVTTVHETVKKFLKALTEQFPSGSTSATDSSSKVKAVGNSSSKDTKDKKDIKNRKYKKDKGGKKGKKGGKGKQGDEQSNNDDEDADKPSDSAKPKDPEVTNSSKAPKDSQPSSKDGAKPKGPKVIQNDDSADGSNDGDSLWNAEGRPAPLQRWREAEGPNISKDAKDDGDDLDDDDGLNELDSA